MRPAFDATPSLFPFPEPPESPQHVTHNFFFFSLVSGCLVGGSFCQASLYSEAANPIARCHMAGSRVASWPILILLFMTRLQLLK